MFFGRKQGKLYIYTTYIYSMCSLYEKQGLYPTVILWVWYGYPMVRVQVWSTFGSGLGQGWVRGGSDLGQVGSGLGQGSPYLIAAGHPAKSDRGANDKDKQVTTICVKNLEMSKKSRIFAVAFGTR